MKQAPAIAAALVLTSCFAQAGRFGSSSRARTALSRSTQGS